MNRRSFLGVVPAVMVAGGVTGAADTKHEHDDCCMECDNCEMSCLACVDACLEEENRKPCIKLCLDCADICGVCAKIGGRNGPMEAIIAAACAEACEKCAEECAKHKDDKLCQACAEQCRKCAKECRTQAKKK